MPAFSLAVIVTFMELKDVVCVITGAARGIGLACAERFLQEGARVVLADLSGALSGKIQEVLRENPERATLVACDVSQQDQVRSLMAAAIQRFGRLDTVIANAGIVHACDPLELSPEDLQRVLQVNLVGVFHTGQQAAKVMLTQQPDAYGCRGSIINMSSVNGVMVIPEIAAYCMAKGGVNQWTKALAIRLAKEGIRVNGIGPGSISTEMFQNVADQPEKLRSVLSRTPMGRPGDPDEIAKVAAFLASHYSSYLTGQTIYPDGGRLGLNYLVATE